MPPLSSTCVLVLHKLHNFTPKFCKWHKIRSVNAEILSLFYAFAHKDFIFFVQCESERCKNHVVVVVVLDECKHSKFFYVAPMPVFV